VNGASAPAGTEAPFTLLTKPTSGTRIVEAVAALLGTSAKVP